jgi:hypothetical protein
MMTPSSTVSPEATDAAFAEAARRAGRDAAAWTVADLERDTGWTIRLDDADRAELLAGLAAGRTPGRPLLQYRRADFPFGGRVLGRLRAAVHEAQHGRGLALVKGLPRDGLDAEGFELLTWAIGLHLGVARPQDRLTRYLNAVRDVGVDYRSPTGRGYSSNDELDFHVDSGDVVLLSCYNQAPVGGDSLVASGVSAWRQLVTERPDLARALEEQAVPYSRQGEQAPDEAPFTLTTVFARTATDVFCAWNRNRIVNGLRLEGAPPASDAVREGVELLDAILRRPEFLYRMRLEPGDLQILSNFTTLHSRTSFTDDPDETRKRTLFRLWIATPDGLALPARWRDKWGATEPGVVKGGMRGHHYDDACRAFERSQAAELGMRMPG